MKSQALLLASLAALATSATALPEGISSIYYPSMCKKGAGIYDVCDTEHSYLRCRGHDAMLIVDCKVGNSSYCRILEGRGGCDGTSPPDLSDDEATPCETASAAAASATKST
ncbi:hypothetical protein F5X97DRAFT_343108 [Nemania serpens]|nr:hypothetical protein F5X97DRAFT_343108 [Nemania serpens]